MKRAKREALSQPVTVSSKHVIGYQSASLSTDGTSAMVVLEVAGLEGAPSERFALTLPVELCSVLRLVGYHLEMQAVKAGKPVKTLLPSINPDGKEDVVIAEAPDEPGMILVVFNPYGSEEMCFKLTHITAMKVGAALRKSIASKLTPEQCAELEMFEKGLILPTERGNEDSKRVG